MKDYRQYRLNITPSPYDERDFKFRAIYPPVELPIKTNNRAFLLPARDQEDTPECAAFAGSSFQQCKDTKEIGLTEYLSPQFIYNQRQEPNEEGMVNRDLMKLLQDKGTCLERLYPFRSYSTPSTDARLNALNHRSNNYASIDTLTELKQALYIKGPCIVAIPVYNYTKRMWFQRAGDEFLGGHDMLAVDFDDEARVIWILNSWGADFGEAGYIPMSYDDFDCAWEWWSAVDLQSVKTTTEAPYTTTDDKTTTPEPESWITKNWLWITIGLVVIGIAISIIF
jgi:hypothetical protein